MEENSTLKLNPMVKKSIISFAMIGVAALAIASSGGGEKKSAAKATPGINLLRTTPGFSLKAGPGNLNARNGMHAVGFAPGQLVTTYRKGNTIYIMPSGNRTARPATVAAGKNNLNLLNVKLSLRK